MEKKMTKIQWRIYQLTHGLMSRFMLIACLIIIPVNLFSIAAVYTIGHAYRENIERTLQSRLDLFVRQIDNYNENLQKAFTNDIISEYLYELTSGDTTDSVLMDIRLKNAMTRLGFDYDSYAACFLYDREKDIPAYFNSRIRLEEDEKEIIAALLRSDEKRTHAYDSFTAGGRDYITVIYSFPYFSFGYCTDAGRLLEIADLRADIPYGALYFLSEDGKTVSSYVKEKSAERNPEDYERTDGAKGIFLKGMDIRSSMASGPYTILYRISPREMMLLYPRIVYIYFVFVILSIAMLPLLYVFAKRLIMNPLYDLADGMQNIEAGDLDYRLKEEYGTYQMDYIMRSFNHMIGEIQHMRIASYEQEIGKLQTETINAHLQVNQHMLLNSLNVVYSLVQTKRMDEAAEFTALLMKYFQYTMRRNSPIVTVSEEMDFIEDYLRLQKIRFKDRFTSVSAVSDEAETVEIPQLLIQGFVENAIKYALVPDRVIEILLNVRKEGGRLKISVADTGAGIPAERLEKIRRGDPVEDMTGRHIGFWNVRKRLEYYYSSDYEMNITSSEDAGTQIFLDLPEHPEEKEEIVRFLREREGETYGA